MKAKVLCLLLVLTSSLFVHSAATAEVLVYPPEPDVVFSFRTHADDARALRAILLDFASEEKLLPVQNAPRAKGKLFFLLLYRGAITIVAEQKSQADAMDVGCLNFNHGDADFDQRIDRLKKLLRRRWPHLVTTYKPWGK